MTTPYSGVHLELYKEALRSVPALVAARQRESLSDGFTLVRAYLERADELGIDHQSAWSIAFSASQITICSLVDTIAGLSGTCEHVVVERMVAATQDAVTSGAL